jgi:hypothetical protein
MTPREAHVSEKDPECYPGHVDFVKCQRPNGRGWNLRWGRIREVEHDRCPECGGCYDCTNGCTTDPAPTADRVLRQIAELTAPATLGPHEVTAQAVHAIVSEWLREFGLSVD